MKERIYLVTGNNQTALVNAPSRQSAVAFIANSQFTAEVASQMDLVKLLTAGMKVQQARQANQELDFEGEEDAK